MGHRNGGRSSSRRIYLYQYDGCMDAAGQLIRNLRRDVGYTQAEVAARAGTSQPAIARYENGTASPSVRTLNRIVRACGGTLILSSSRAPRSNLDTDMGRLVRTHRAAIVAILREHGFVHPRVFGSTARGTTTAASDLDLLADPADDLDLMKVIDAQHDLEELLGVHVDFATPELLKPRVRAKAEREAVPI